MARNTHRPEMHRRVAWKQPVRVATTAAGTLASDFENGDTVDGKTLATGDRVLIKNQAAGAENGIYVVKASGAPARAFDMDDANEVVGAKVYVVDGTANGGKTFHSTNLTTPTLGATALTFAEDTGGVGGDVATDSIWDAKGDLAVGTGADTASRLPVGTDGWHLVADSGEATGLSWAEPAAGTTAPFYNVADYGATGDGTTDDTSAIEDAIAAADATNGGTIYFPPGTYKITTTLSFTGGDYHLLGSGGRYSASIIHQVTSNTDALSFAPSSGTAIRTKASRIENLTIAGPGGASSGAGVRTTNDVHMTHCFVYGFYYGAYLGTASYYSLLFACTFTDCDHSGVYLNFTNNTTIDSCRFTGAFPGYSAPIGALAYGIYINGGLAQRVINSSIEYFTHWGIFCTAGPVEIIGNYFETGQATQANDALVFCSGGKGVAIIANYFQASNAAWSIDLGSSAVTGVIIAGNRIQAGTAGAVRTRDSTVAFLIGNDVTGTKTLTATTYDLDAYPPMADPMTTRGDIIYRNASNATARLAVGAAGRVFASDGTDPAWTATGGDVTGAITALTVGKLQGRTVASSLPSTDDVLTWDGSQWAPAAIPPGGVTEITDLPTAETNDTLVLAPDGVGGVEWRAETTGGTPGDTVEDETTWGITPAAGASAAYSRADHTHGSPAEPETGALSDDTPLVESGAGDAGDAATASRSDHVHPVGGVGLTKTEVGYTTVGGSLETLSGNTVYMKKFTMAQAGLVASGSLYMSPNGDNVATNRFAIMADNAGSPGDLMATSVPFVGNTFLLSRAGPTNQAAWITIPIGIWLTAGDYWLAWEPSGTNVRIAYDAGSDRKYTSGGTWVAHGGRYTDSDTTRKYSAYATVVY